jgi:hypothetical protein
MTNRIAPDEGIQKHGDTIMYLNNLSIELKLATVWTEDVISIPTINEWQKHRADIERCRYTDLTEHWLLGYKVKETHPQVLTIVDDIIALAEYGPWPVADLMKELHIQRLREAIRELEGCREQVVWHR